MKRGTIPAPLFARQKPVVKMRWRLEKIGAMSSVASRGRQAPAAPHNVPRYLTSFVGRETDLRALKASLRSSRLVTLVGPGGAGKSRLAAEIGGTDADLWPDGGIWK